MFKHRMAMLMVMAAMPRMSDPDQDGGYGSGADASAEAPASPAPTPDAPGITDATTEEAITPALVAHLRLANSDLKASLEQTQTALNAGDQLLRDSQAETQQALVNGQAALDRQQANAAKDLSEAIAESVQKAQDAVDALAAIKGSARAAVEAFHDLSNVLAATENADYATECAAVMEKLDKLV